MTQPDADAKFLLEGLQHFPDAHATVSAFRRVLAKRVEGVLGTPSAVWRTKEVKPTRGESNGLWAGAGGQMELTALAGKKLSLDVGILWGASHFTERVVALAAVYAATTIVGRLEDPAQEGVQLVRAGVQDLFALPLGNDTTDLEGAFRRVVGAAEKAVAAAIARASSA